MRSPIALQRFDDCGPLLSHLKSEALKRVTPWGVEGVIGLRGPGVVDFYSGSFSGATAPMPQAVPAAPGVAGGSAGGDRVREVRKAADAGAYSTTNVQERGVDEPDIVKTDGARVLAIERGRLFSLDVTGDGGARRTGSMRLPEGYDHQMLVDGNRALIFSSGEWPKPPATPASGYGFAGQQGMIVSVVELSDPERMRVVTTLRVEGSYVSARMVDGIARVVVRSQASGIDFTQPTEEGSPRLEKSVIARNRRAVRRSTLDHWLPEYRVEDRRGPVRRTSQGRLSSCNRVHRTREFSGFGSTTVMTLDPDHPTPSEGVTVLGSAEIVYSSTQRLYVALNRWEDQPDRLNAPAPGRGSGRGAPSVTPSITTQIHAFDITDPLQARYVASGTVAGHILNQWSLSEHDGHLRVASTLLGTTQSESIVTVLQQRSGLLAQVGRVGGLGKNERIYGVRFMGDRGYVVTFRQVDPLYVIDLKDPAKPLVRGELKIPGYSAYLHPVGDDLLLGVGAAATNEGRRTGTQVSLFDVSDPAAPKQLHVRTMKNTYTEVEQTHLAFLWWQPSSTAVLPMQGPEDGEENGEYVSWVGGFRVDRVTGIDRAGTVRHPRVEPPDGAEGQGYVPQIHRSLVVGDRLFTLSESGLMASRLDGLRRINWVSWPAPPAE